MNGKKHFGMDGNEVRKTPRTACVIAGSAGSNARPGYQVIPFSVNSLVVH
jgi:hypothetical protein